MKWIKDNYHYIVFTFCAIYAIIGISFGMYCAYEDRNAQTEIQNVEVRYIEKIRYATEQEQIEHDKEEVEMIARTVWGEDRGGTRTTQAAVVWCILNRVDDERFPDNITDVLLQKNQFSGYAKNYPVDSDIVKLVEDVMTRWEFEKTAVGDVGRVLPKEYCWFRGDSKCNYFRDAYSGNYNIWDWSLNSPYEVG